MMMTITEVIRQGHTRIQYLQQLEKGAAYSIYIHIRDFKITLKKIISKNEEKWDFPGSPVVKCVQCQGSRFDAWWGN